MSKESERLEAHYRGEKNWLKWGPYLSERQWGTVREDYSEHGDAWDYFPHDHARSRVYRWGEDGISGITNNLCNLNFALALDNLIIYLTFFVFLNYNLYYDKENLPYSHSKGRS